MYRQTTGQLAGGAGGFKTGKQRAMEREQAEREAAALDRLNRSHSDDEPRPSTFESIVNRVERVTGLDIDGDGDVGLAGHHNDRAKEQPRADRVRAMQAAGGGPYTSGLGGRGGMYRQTTGQLAGGAGGFKTGKQRAMEREQATREAAALDRLNRSHSDDEPRSKALESFVNRLERVTGLDIDGDGDVGLVGHSNDRAKEQPRADRIRALQAAGGGAHITSRPAPQGSFYRQTTGHVAASPGGFKTGKQRASEVQSAACASPFTRLEEALSSDGEPEDADNSRKSQVRTENV